MKKFILSILLIFLILIAFNNIKGQNEKIILKLQKGNKTIYINDQPLEMDVAPIEVPPGRIMVPVRFVSEGLGASVNWDGKTETITITMDSVPYLKYKIIQLSNEIENKNRTIEELKNKIGESPDISNLKKELEEKDKKIDELNQKINELQKENEELKNKLKECESKEQKEELYLVKNVIDGDTIELEDGRKIRYIGINAPESGQNFYEESKKRNKELVEGKKVKLEFDVEKFDKYGRTLAYVFVGDIFVNLQLVKEGLAVVETIPPNIKYVDDLLNAQKYAQENGLGIWKKSEIKLKIININYDAPGNDNLNLNGEWVEIKNLGKDPVNMKNFVLKDLANHIFTFPDYTLNPNSVVKIYSGCGTNTKDSLYWCSTGAIWNNDTDTAFLYDNNGNLIDKYTYP